jgi:hypothetical protein
MWFWILLGKVGEEEECCGVMDHLDDFVGVFCKVIENEAKV